MLSLKERREYYKKHKKDFQRRSDLFVKENNKQERETAKKLNTYDPELLKIIKKDPKAYKPKKYKPFIMKRTLITDKDIESFAKIKYTNSKKVVCGKDITEYLDKIKDKEDENIVYLLIKNKEIIKANYYSTNSTRVNESVYIKDLLQEAKKLGVDSIAKYHNHPIDVTATPSRMDIHNYYFSKDEYKDERIKLLDSGIVTFDDFYSTAQVEKIAKKIQNSAKKKGINDVLELDLIKYMYIYKDTRLRSYKKRHHPHRIFKDKNKVKLADSKTNEEYSRIRRNAKKHLLEIEKELNMD